MFERVCPHCGCSLTLGSVLKLYWHRWRDTLTKTTALRCPRCRFPNPVKARRCDQCQADLTVQLAVHSVVEPSRHRWQEFLRRASPATKRRIQWVFLMFSAGLLWWLLAYVENHGGSAWPLYMALSIIYVAVVAFFALWLIPKKVFQGVFRWAPPLVKLALALNGLSLMLIVELLIRGWWARALILAGLFGVAWAGALLLYEYILPMAAVTEEVFLGSQTQYDPSSPQGRKVRLE
jgi:hypothetical protein